MQNDDSKETKQSEEDLNLGLGNLLNPISGVLSKPVIENNTNTDNSPESDLISNSITSINNEYSSYWGNSDFKKIIELAEQNAISSNLEQKIIAKIWWVRANNKINALPTNFLASSLLNKEIDSIFSKISKNDNEQGKLAENIYCELYEKLKDGSDAKCTIQILERLVSYNSSYAGTLKNVVASELLNLSNNITNHYERDLNNDYKKYLNNLKDRIDSTSYRDNLNKDFTNTKPLIVRENRKSLNLWKIVFTLLLGLLLFLIINQPDKVNIINLFEKEHSDLTLVKSEFINPRAQLPENARMPIANQAKLEDILDELIEDTENNKNSKTVVVEDKNVESTVSQNSIKQTLNTEAPVEPRELSDLVTAYDTHKLDPSLNKQHKEPFEEPLINGESNDNRIVKGYDKIPGTNNRAKDRKPLGGRIYRVQRFSDVYSNPSLRSKVLATLEPNQHVEVIEDLGSWYKILSEKGREGYVFSNCCEVR